MDNPTQIIQPMTPTPSPTQPLPKQTPTKWIIIGLLILASIVTGMAYFIVRPTSPQPSSNQTATSLTPSPTPSETAKWTTYTNTKYHYSFFYPVTWKMTTSGPDEKGFVLRLDDTKDPALIKGDYLSSKERSSLPPTYCETTTDPSKCHTYELTATSKALVYREDTQQTTKAEALITMPDEGTLHLQITDQNLTSYDTMAIVIDSLTFPNEKRVSGMQVCPDSWPTTKTEVDYNGIKIAVANLDQDWIKTNCKY